MSAASFRAGGRTTAYPLPEFASATPGSKFVAADGRWMGQPDALVTGTAANGSQAEALLVLAQPVYDVQARVSHPPHGLSRIPSCSTCANGCYFSGPALYFELPHCQQHLLLKLLVGFHPIEAAWHELCLKSLSRRCVLVADFVVSSPAGSAAAASSQVQGRRGLQQRCPAWGGSWPAAAGVPRGWHSPGRRCHLH